MKLQQEVRHVSAVTTQLNGRKRERSVSPADDVSSVEDLDWQPTKQKITRRAYKRQGTRLKRFGERKDYQNLSAGSLLIEDDVSVQKLPPGRDAVEPVDKGVKFSINENKVDPPRTKDKNAADDGLGDNTVQGYRQSDSITINKEATVTVKTKGSAHGRDLSLDQGVPSQTLTDNESDFFNDDNRFEFEIQDLLNGLSPHTRHRHFDRILILNYSLDRARMLLDISQKRRAALTEKYQADLRRQQAEHEQNLIDIKERTENEPKEIKGIHAVELQEKEAKIAQLEHDLYSQNARIREMGTSLGRLQGELARYRRGYLPR